jgi:hypothetical protein
MRRLVVLVLVCAGQASVAFAHPGVQSPLSHVDGVVMGHLPEQPPPRGGLFGHPLLGAARARATAGIVSLALPGVWCGQRRTTDDVTDQLANGDYRYHAIYAVPAGTTDRFEQVANTLQADAFEASELLERLYGRAIRFDMGTNCGPQYLDISVVQLPQSAPALEAAASNANGILTTLADDLQGAGFDPLPMQTTRDAALAKNTNYVLWLEGVSPAGLCGVGTEFTDPSRTPWNFNNGGGKLAVIYRDGADFCNSNIVRHEIGHTLGAVQPNAPHASDGAHCNDSYEDTMCYPQSPKRGTGSYENQYFDYGNDDYWDPPGGALPFWTVNLSRFLCPDVACNVPSNTSATGKLPQILGGGDLLDQDADVTNDVFATCPQLVLIGGHKCRSNAAGSSGSEVRVASVPRVSFVLDALQMPRHRWRISLRLRYDGHVIVQVRCRRGNRQVMVLKRHLTARRTIRATVSCDSRPRATVTPE